MSAFLTMNTVPAGHGVVYIDDDRHAPFLQPGEMAVVDYTDRTIESGELFLINQSRGPIIWQVNSVSPERICFVNPDGTDDLSPAYMLSPCNKPRTLDESNRRLFSGKAHLSDGPLEEHHLQSVILGRVVGIYDPSYQPRPVELPAWLSSREAVR